VLKGPWRPKEAYFSSYFGAAFYASDKKRAYRRSNKDPGEFFPISYADFRRGCAIHPKIKIEVQNNFGGKFLTHNTGR
jgi:hypothetical protein